MRNKDLVSIDRLTSEEVGDLLTLAKDLKAVYRHGGRVDSLRGKVLAMVFAKPSLRTRVSFEVATVQLGGHAMYITHAEVGLGKREAVPDAAKVLSRMVDGIMIRTFAQGEVDGLAQHASIPVINGLTDLYHPCQALADLMTIDEHFGTLDGIRVAYIGDGNNVAHSLINGARRTPISLAIAIPRGYEPKAEIVAAAQAEIGTRLTIGYDPVAAVRGAHVIYTDVWASMGQEGQREERLARFAGFQVNDELLGHSAPDAVVMHCLPAHRGEEITDAVMDGPRAIVFDQAENRLHLQRALLHALMGSR
ncbi:MAG: ornithine carbamoyltransferase [Candidatus Eisenbacteria bacterium]|jgi:ornithine carbamoyltransferase|nr:ornithine carbamoyltransferase [Candidatus Eisenbacteria bacterium]